MVARAVDPVKNVLKGSYGWLADVANPSRQGWNVRCECQKAKLFVGSQLVLINSIANAARVASASLGYKNP